MTRKHLVLPALALLAVAVTTGAAVSGVTADSVSTRSDAHGRRAPSVHSTMDSQNGLIPIVEAPPATEPAPPDTTSAPEPVPQYPPRDPAPAQTPSAAPSAPPQVASAPSPCGGFGSAILGATNADRAANGLGALCGNDQLAGLAQNWANWMAQNGSLTHQNLGGIIGSTPFHAMGENILVAPPGTSVAQIEAAWMSSPEHRANILSGSFSAAATGIAVSSDGRVWACVDFGG